MTHQKLEKLLRKEAHAQVKRAREAALFRRFSVIHHASYVAGGLKAFELMRQEVRNSDKTATAQDG